MAGRMAPQFAAGEWETLLEESTRTSTADLLTLTVDLSALQRSNLLAEFNRGRSRMALTLSTKLACWHQLPLKFIALAHPQDRPKKSVSEKLPAA